MALAAKENLVTRTAKRLYKELFFQKNTKQLYQHFFPSKDKSTSANFLLDKFIQDPYGVTYRHADTESALRPYVNGAGQLIEIPRSSSKTPISEELLEKVHVGLDATSGFGLNEAAIIQSIVEDHVSAYIMTKNKQALEVFEDGLFEAHGVDDTSLNINYARESELSFDYNYTTVGNSFSDSVAEQQEILRDNNCSLDNMVMLLGQDMLTEYSEDEFSTNASQNNGVNQLVTNGMKPGLLKGTQGLYVIGQLRTKRMLAPVWLTSYSPGVKYKATKAATGSQFMPTNKSIMYSLDDRRFNVMRGVQIKAPNGKIKTVVGDVVFDKFTKDDPCTTFLRSHTRHGFVPANINHISVMTGTFE